MGLVLKGGELFGLQPLDLLKQPQCFPHHFAGGALATAGDLVLHELRQFLGHGYIHIHDGLR